MPFTQTSNNLKLLILVRSPKLKTFAATIQLANLSWITWL